MSVAAQLVEERYRYRASRADGRVVEGIVRAAGHASALEELRRQQLVPVDLQPLGGDGRATASRQSRGGAVAGWARTMATLLDAGVPLDRALLFAATHAGHHAVAEASAAARADVQGGVTLGEALGRHRAVFGPLVTAMVVAGEESGALAQAMSRLADHLDESNALWAQVRSALMYPAIMAGASLAGIGVLLAFVVPRFAAMLAETGGRLPWSTRALVGVSHVLTAEWWVVVLLTFAGIAASRAWIREEANRRRLHAARLRWPVIGAVESAYATARFARAFGMLLGSGMPVVSALRIARVTVSNLAMDAMLDRAAEDVRHGGRIAPALEPLLPPLAAQLLAVGEETGRVDELARQVAETYERELTRTLRSVVGLIEPVLILAFALLVGFVALAMLQAIYSINAGVSLASNITMVGGGA